MILDYETIKEIEDYIKQLDEIVGLKPETLQDVEKALSKQKGKLKTDHSFMKQGDTVLVTYGFNDVLNKPFQFLYEFGFYTKSGCVVYIEGCRNMQDSYHFKLEQVKPATDVDKRNHSWGN
jgi:hypothetical protein